MDEQLLVFNGVDGASGRYLLPPLSPQQISRVAQGETLDKAQLAELQNRLFRTQAHLGVKEGVDPRDLADAGWGLILAQNADPAIRAALAPLLDHRRAQATQKRDGRYKEYTGLQGYRPGESKLQWLARQGAGPGPVDPDRVPYYLLLVGDPEAIPYPFQYQLDVQYAVGRVWFATLDEYARYAQSVVAAETGASARPRRATFFGVANPDDRPTQLSSRELIGPLAATLAGQYPDWTVETVLRDQATKARLEQVYGGPDTPALLVTASHGMGFPDGDPRQRPAQGALLCQDWPGPLAWDQEIPPDFYLAAADIADSAHLGGLIAFHFACFGAGTPRLDDFAHLVTGEQAALAPEAFVAALPRRVLGHPAGGALAVIGHVERAWGYSFAWTRAGRQVEVFLSTMKRILAGYPVGAAVEFFNERYAELACSLSDELQEIRFGKIPDDVELSGIWTASNDARSYVVVGDPAVRLAL